MVMTRVVSNRINSRNEPTAKPLPKWLVKKAHNMQAYTKMEALCRKYDIHTVCEEAQCPNQGECFENGTATFMILGDICTRNCRFCAVKHGIPEHPDLNEPKNVAMATKQLGLRHVVITSVTRDDLKDGGAEHYVKTIQAIRLLNPQTTIEVLIPDFQANQRSIRSVVSASPDIINHNLETVPALYKEVRPQANYLVSLELLRRVKALNDSILTKSGLMLGLGEKWEQVISVMGDLSEVKCDILTLGQYLRPSPNHVQIKEYVSPERFDEYKRIGEELGFKYVASGPYVRSSFNATNIAESLVVRVAKD